MMRKMLSSGGLILLLLVMMVGTAAAQSGTDQTATSTATPTGQPGGSTLYQHPIVQILAAYFGRTTRTRMPTPTPTAVKTQTGTPPEAPSVTPTVPPVLGPEEFAEQIAKYHQEGMGFGVLVKIYAMAQASLEDCANQSAMNDVVEPTQAACVPVMVEQLIREFRSGGMGQLFKEYRKPALLGVGHVKKALQKEPQVTSTPNPTLTSTPVPSQGGAKIQSQNQGQKSNNGNSQGNKSMKVKPPKAQGAKK